MYFIRWFLSKTVRQASYLNRHVIKLRNAQRDILSEKALAELNNSISSMSRLLREGADKEKLKKEMASLEAAGNKWLKSYPNAGIRENVEVALVAIAVAMGIRTFFLQPFKIPTGSMQPTLYGIHMEDLRDDPDFELPSLPVRIFEAVAKGRFYHVLQAEADGELEYVTPKKEIAFVINTQTIGMIYREPDGTVRREKHRMWFTPDGGERSDGLDTLWKRSDLGAPNQDLLLERGRTFKKGDYIVKVLETSGDHLFVDRLTYNFRRPQRGEIIVFDTSHIQHERMRIPHPRIPDLNTFYIKRMVAMGSEKVRILNDRHLEIDGVRLDASTPHFENVYTFEGPPEDSEYSGTLNDHVADQYKDPRYGSMFPLFPDENTVYTVRPDHYMVMGDNTMNSFDSRAWGDFPQENVIGKSFFVYWPISDRFGWGHR
jgi:signal peptidase I